VGILLLVILIGGSIGLVRLNAALSQARQAERATQEQLFDALLVQAGGNCLSRRPGQRFESLEIVKRAARLARELQLPAERFFQLRNKAILALALPDLYVPQTWDGLPDGGAKVDFDEDLAVYAWMDKQGRCEVRRVAGNHVLHRFDPPADAPGLDVEPNLTPDGQFLALRWLYAPRSLGAKLHLFRLTGETSKEPLFEEQNVYEVGFDKAGRRAVLGHTDGSVSVHELGPRQTAALLRRFPSGRFKSGVIAALHPTEPWVAVISYHGPKVVEIRDWQRGAVLKTLELPESAGDVAWHPDGLTLAVSAGDCNDIWLYESATWNRARTLHGILPSNRIAFNPTGDRLASVAWKGRVHLFDVGTGKLLFHTLTAHGPMLRLRFSRDGRRLACSSDGKQLGIWEVGDAREYRTLLYKGEGAGKFGDVIDVWTDNRLVLTPFHNSLRFWDLETGQEIGELPAEHNQPGMPQFVPGGPQRPGAMIMEMAAGIFRLPIQQEEQSPATLRIGPPQFLSPIHSYCSDYSQDGRLMACASRTIAPYTPFAGGWILRADRPGPPIRRLEEGSDILYVALSPDGALAVTSPQLHGVNRVWDVASGQHLKDLGSGSSTFPCFSPDGKWLAVSGDTGALYTVGTWEKGLGFNGFAQFSPDSRQLAVSTKKGYIRLIDIGQGRDLAWFEEPNQELIGIHRFSPDGTRLITISSGKEGGIHVWDLRAIRRQLKALDLDWEAPEYPPELPPTQTPLRLKILPGPSGE
jgi:WD40 repeat protein